MTDRPSVHTSDRQSADPEIVELDSIVELGREQEVPQPKEEIRRNTAANQPEPSVPRPEQPIPEQEEESSRLFYAPPPGIEDLSDSYLEFLGDTESSVFSDPVERPAPVPASKVVSEKRERAESAPTVASVPSEQEQSRFASLEATLRTASTPVVPVASSPWPNNEKDVFSGAESPASPPFMSDPVPRLSVQDEETGLALGRPVADTDSFSEEREKESPQPQIIAPETYEEPGTLSGSGGDGDLPPPVPPVTGGGSPEPENDADEKPMSLLEHLGELRVRLMRSFLAVIICFFGCYAFAQDLFHYLTLPLLGVMPVDSKFIYTGVAEGFFVDLKVGFVAAVFVASPFIFYQIWAFIAPGLYEDEKRYVIPLAFCSALFFLGGAAFCYLVVFPFAFKFFMSYSTENIVAMLSINEYLSFALKMLLAFGLIFEMPLFAFLLARMGLVTAAWLRSVRKYAILVVFVVAAILTPPDVFSQIMMALPMLLLYELSIYVAVIFGKPKKKGASEDKTEAEQEEGANA